MASLGVSTLFPTFFSSALVGSNYSNITTLINEIDSSKEVVSPLSIHFDKIKYDGIENIDAYVSIFSNIFQCLSEINRQKSYPKELTESLSNYVESVLFQLDEHERDCFASLILDSIVQHPFTGTDVILIKILENVIERHQEVLSNIIYTKISGGIILPLQALQYVHNRFETTCKKKGLLINFQALDSFEEFQDALEKLKSTTENTQISFMVRHFESAHVTPVFVEKTNNNYKFFISDSLGHLVDKQVNSPRFTKEMIKNICNFMDGQNFVLYASKKQRQKDHTNCTIFSIIDSKKIFSIEKIFNHLEEHSTLEMFNAGSNEVPCNTLVYWVEKLPLKLELTTQSLKEIIESSQVFASQQENAYKEKKLISIQKKYTWYVVESGFSDYRKKIAQNSYIVVKRNKLIKMIIDETLGK